MTFYRPYTQKMDHSAPHYPALAKCTCTLKFGLAEDQTGNWCNTKLPGFGKDGMLEMQSLK